MTVDIEKLDGATLDVAQDNLNKLKQLFPSVVTETLDDKGVLRVSIDKVKLQAELGSFADVFDNRRERYGMDWPGKKDALKLVQTPSYATLKPCRDESVDFDNTENLYIEGDNLEVLKKSLESLYGFKRPECARL